MYTLNPVAYFPLIINSSLYITWCCRQGGGDWPTVSSHAGTLSPSTPTLSTRIRSRATPQLLAAPSVLHPLSVRDLC